MKCYTTDMQKGLTAHLGEEQTKLRTASMQKALGAHESKNAGQDLESKDTEEGHFGKRCRSVRQRQMQAECANKDGLEEQSNN